MNLEHLLIIRNDKLGDTLLSLPAVQLCRKYFPKAKIDFLCQEIYHPILKNYLASLNVNLVSSSIDFKKYQAVLILWEHNGLTFQAWKNRVPVRVGLYSKLSSFLFLNLGLRQKRSQAEKSEAEYNLDLVHLLAKKFSMAKIETIEPISLHSQHNNLNLNTPYVVIHPGQAGSALNISADTYSEIFNYLDSKNITIYFTKGSHPIDKEYIEKIQNKNPQIKILENLSLETLLDIYKNSKLVIAPSTGPLHLAHYSGTRTLGFYPPILHQSAARWAPYGGMGKSYICTPKADCLAKEGCMDNMDWQPLLEKALSD